MLKQCENKMEISSELYDNKMNSIGGNPSALHNTTIKRDKLIKNLINQRAVNIRKWRMLSGISTVGLAKKLDVHWNTISNWEKGGTIPYWA